MAEYHHDSQESSPLSANQPPAFYNVERLHNAGSLEESQRSKVDFLKRFYLGCPRVKN